MFVQVIKGRTHDAAAMRAQAEKWVSDVKPGAIGFLGGTVGVAEDGSVIALARFEDQAAAEANGARPEQDAWWQSTEALFDGAPTFRESTDTSTLFDGPSNAARFVQIMEGTVPDRAKAEAAETPELEAQLRTARPDLLGALRVWFDGGEYVEVAYFTNEEDARAGESADDFEGPQQDYAAMFGEPTYTDVRDPIHT